MSERVIKPSDARSLSRHAGDTVRLAAPLAITQLSQMAMSITDTVMLGGISADALAAGGLGASIAFSVTMVLQGVLSSISVAVSHARGSNSEHLISRIYWSGLLLAGLLSLPAFALLSAVEQLLLWVHEPAGLAHEVGRYCQVLRWSAPATLLGLGIMRAFLPAMGATQRLLWVAIGGIFINAFLNYGLIHGAFGLPRLGFLGSALATTLTVWLSAVVLMLLVHGSGQYRPLLGLSRPHWPVLAELFAIGWPVAITYGAEIGFFLVTSLMVGIFGAAALAAHQIALNAASVAFMLPLAVGQAANVRVAFWLGARQARAARRAGIAALVLGIGCMTISALIMLAMPRTLVGFYIRLDDPANRDTVELATMLLGITALFQIVDGLQVVGSGCLRGYKDTRLPMVLAAVGYWAVGLPIGYVLGIHLGYGVVGLWWGLAAGLACVAALMTWRFFRVSRIRMSAS